MREQMVGQRSRPAGSNPVPDHAGGRRPEAAPGPGRLAQAAETDRPGSAPGTAERPAVYQPGPNCCSPWVTAVSRAWRM